MPDLNDPQLAAALGDLETLTHVSEWVTTLCEAIDRVSSTTAAAIVALREQQAELRDDLHAVAHRLEGVTRAVGSLSESDVRLLRRDLESLQGDVRDLERRAS